MEMQWHELTRVFAGKTAADRGSLAIGDRSLVALLGPSGCGRTTMFNTVAGGIAPTAGGILFDGCRVGEMAEVLCLHSQPFYIDEAIRKEVQDAKASFSK